MAGYNLTFITNSKHFGLKGALVYKTQVCTLQRTNLVPVSIGTISLLGDFTSYVIWAQYLLNAFRAC